jgi:transcriptional regulator with XRE-family HTH domain
MEGKNVNQDGLRLKEFRKFKNISQKELAEILECSQPNLSKIENGDIGVSKSLSEKLFNEFMDLNPSWLLLGSGFMLQKPYDGPVISIGDYNPDDFEVLDSEFKRFQSLIIRGEVPLPAISVMFRNLRYLLGSQQETIIQLKETLKTRGSDI